MRGQMKIVPFVHVDKNKQMYGEVFMSDTPHSKHGWDKDSFWYHKESWSWQSGCQGWD